MRSHSNRSFAALAAAVAVAVALAGSCRTAQTPLRPARQATPQQPLVSPVDSLVAPPVIRVGVLTEAARVSVAAEHEVVVWASSPGDPSPHRSGVQRAT